MTAARELPFFVYGTLRPGQYNHGLFLRGRTAGEEPALLPGARLYDGPGYPYAVAAGTAEGGDGGGDGRTGDGPVAVPGIAGDLVTAAPGAYGELLGVLDRLEEYRGPGHPRNLYERVERTVVRLRDGVSVPAWVYLAAPGALPGPVIPGGDWVRRTAAPVRGGPRTP
ncbi:gamma-glutamylcyclotransferase family protein [Streptomyces sp. NPDC053755]|uniref:gamma-glutamylcyclotransferase family protein n=1 Tax=Streptomyces sp. NPDC053755 TaxID=3155815 RepID=UPI00342A540F